MNISTIIALLILVESGGNNLAVGDNGLALGCLQIHKIMVEDINRIYKTNYKQEDCFYRIVSIKICKLYFKHYCNQERLGFEPTLETYCRCWVAGPNGYKKECSLPYWKRAKRLYENHIKEK